ncbi:MAG: LamG domain-containing protein, partial [Candidatus Heimdallarchaeaceae archaeon]
MIKIYKDNSANAIFIEDTNGVQFMNSLQATTDNGFCSIHDLAREIEIVTNEDFSEFVDENENNYGNNATEVCNSLNAIFSSSGTPTENPPVITSALTINSVQGAVINYELTADYGVGYEWDFSNVSGIVNVEGNPRKLIGGSALPTGTYQIPVKAINYNDEDSKTITLNVATPPFASTKSIKFDNLNYLSGNATLLNDSLGRSGNGSGSSDAWTISFWLKPQGTQNNQTFFYFGGNDNNNEGHIWLRYYGGSSFRGIMLEYGTANNNLKMLMSSQSIPLNQWTHFLVSYDGGTTGSSSGNMSTYYSRFKFYADGSLISTSNTHQNFGYNGSIKDEILQVGKKGASTSYIRNSGKIDEIAVWDSDQSSNISDIYNDGNTLDYSTLTNKPKHWWRMGDGDTYPNLQDSGTDANSVFVMNAMTIA